MTRTLLVTAVLTLLMCGLVATPIYAADPPAQFSAALQSAQDALLNVQAATTADSTSLARAQLRVALPDLQNAQSQLQNALDTATDDVTRSRAQGLLNHVSAAVTSMQTGLAGPDEQLVSRADAARGEIQEAINELPQAAPIQVSPAQAPARPTPAPVSPAPAPSASPIPSQLPRAGELTSIGLPLALSGSGLVLLLIAWWLGRRARHEIGEDL